MFFEVRPVLSICGKDLLDSLAVVFHGVADRFDGQSRGQVGGRKVVGDIGILGAGFRGILNWLFTGADIRDQQAVVRGLSEAILDLHGNDNRDTCPRRRSAPRKVAFGRP